MTTERDELRGTLANTVCNVSNYPRPAQPHLLGGDMGTVLDKAADAILAAGYRKPQQVTTVAELEALPVGSVVIDRDGMALQKTQWNFRGTGWNAMNGTRDIFTEELESDCFPATVLHVGTAL